MVLNNLHFSSFKYLFICIISLVFRLFMAGYCHGDLHSGNIMIYGGVSSFAEHNRIVPAASPLGFNNGGCLLIDWGFSWRHNHPLPPVLDYATFSIIIQSIGQALEHSPQDVQDTLAAAADVFDLLQK